MKSTWKRFKIWKNTHLHRAPYLCAIILSLASLFAAYSTPLFAQPRVEPVIDSSNFNRYKLLLPAEISPLFSDPAFSIKVGEDTQSALNKAKNLAEAALDSRGTLRGFVPSQEGLPFQIPENESLPKETSNLGYKILWNMQSTFWSQHFFTYNFTLRYLEGEKIKNSVQGTFSRLYPFQLGAGFPEDQFFRELIKLSNPKAVANYSWLTFRLSSHEPDLVWIYSPFIKKERKIAPSMRDESLYFSELGATHLMTFSGKPDNYDVRVIEKKSYLAPLMKNELVESSPSTNNPCFSPFPMKENDVFINRIMWKIELASRDPYSPARKVILYIDSETFLPLYAFEYNNLRKLEKIIWSRFAAFPRADKAIPFRFVLRSTTVKNIALHASTEFSIQDGKLCETLPKEWSLKNFDPSFSFASGKARGTSD